VGERASIFDNFIEQFPIIKHLDCWLECYECGEEEEEEEEAAAAAAAEEEEEAEFLDVLLQSCSRRMNLSAQRQVKNRKAGALRRVYCVA
jgi:DNA-directed RNA polymerase subunit N (RpoN/RPB10)